MSNINIICDNVVLRINTARSLRIHMVHKDTCDSSLTLNRPNNYLLFSVVIEPRSGQAALAAVQGTRRLSPPADTPLPACKRGVFTYYSNLVTISVVFGKAIETK